MAYNIIFYFSDQQRWDTCGCFGQPLDITPNLDALAGEGVKFDNAFSPQPVCGPCHCSRRENIRPRPGASAIISCFQTE